MSWTEGKIETLRRMHGEGQSFTLIAEAVGMTRNACIGKARRLELPMRVTKTTKNGEPKPKGKKRRYFSIVRAGGAGNKMRILETVQTDLPEFECDVVPLGKTLGDLQRNDCRYIGDNGLYCGHPVHMRSYCAAHFTRCYVEPRKRWGASPLQAISSQKPVSIHHKIVSVDSGNLSDADQARSNLALASPEIEAA